MTPEEKKQRRASRYRQNAAKLAAKWKEKKMLRTQQIVNCYIKCIPYEDDPEEARV